MIRTLTDILYRTEYRCCSRDFYPRAQSSRIYAQRSDLLRMSISDICLRKVRENCSTHPLSRDIFPSVWIHTVHATLYPHDRKLLRRRTHDALLCTWNISCTFISEYFWKISRKIRRSLVTFFQNYLNSAHHVFGFQSPYGFHSTRSY